MKSFTEMANEIIKSKKWWTMFGWCSFLGYTASQAPSADAVDILRSASWVIAAWLVAQSFQDCAKAWTDTNGDK